MVVKRTVAIFFFLLGFDSEEKDTRSEPNLFDFEFAGLISPKR